MTCLGVHDGPTRSKLLECILGSRGSSRVPRLKARSGSVFHQYEKFEVGKLIGFVPVSLRRDKEHAKKDA